MQSAAGLLLAAKSATTMRIDHVDSADASRGRARRRRARLRGATDALVSENVQL